MGEADKECREWGHIDRFKESWAPLRAAVVIRPKSKRPDFVAALEFKLIGIEHTEILQGTGDERGSELRQIESNEDRLVRSACSRYEEMGLPPVAVGFQWHEHTPVSSARARELAKTVAEIVAKHLPETGHSVRVEYPLIAWNLLPPEISSIRVARLEGSERNFWRSHRAHYPPRLSVEDVVLAIERKERHVLEYRKECDELWLLLVVDGSTPSSNFLSVPSVREHRFQSSFDDLFLFDAFSSQVVALRKTEAHE